jgi:hypothetical protein
MHDWELEVQTDRKALTIMSDGVDRILNSIRELNSQKGSEGKANQETMKYTIKAGVLGVDVKVVRTMMTGEVIELVGLLFYRECVITVVLSLLKAQPLLSISWSRFPFLIFFSIGKANVELDNITMDKKITLLKIRGTIQNLQANALGGMSCPLIS